jgi:hypothetical protein
MRERAVPDHAIPISEDVQTVGQPLNPTEIGQQLAAVMRRKAELSRLMLECDFEAARLLAIIQNEQGYKGKRFSEFALAHGVGSRTDAFDLLVLNEADAPPEAVADDPFHEYPTWRQVWREFKRRLVPPRDVYCITPPELAAEIRGEFHGEDYYDPCPFPLPDDHDALETEWGPRNYLNPPFISRHEKKGRGLTHFARKMIEQERQGKTIKMVVPCNEIITMLLEAGASVRSLGRVPWLHATTGEPMKHPVPCVLFTLGPDRPPPAANDNHPMEEPT